MKDKMILAIATQFKNSITPNKGLEAFVIVLQPYHLNCITSNSEITVKAITSS